MIGQPIDRGVAANPLIYEPRPAAFHGCAHLGDHRIKLYTIRAPRHRDAALPSRSAMEGIVAAILLPELDNDHKVGFAILHWANDGHCALINTWYDANMLRLGMYGCDDLNAAETTLRPLDHLRVIACVWELDIYKFERDLWIREVLGKRPERLSDAVLQPYLEHGFEGMT